MCLVWQAKGVALRAVQQRALSVKMVLENRTDCLEAEVVVDESSRVWSKTQDGRVAWVPLWMQRLWVWRILEARERMLPACYQGVQQDCSPGEHHVSVIFFGQGLQTTNLALALPIAYVLDEASAADIHLRSRTDEHVSGRYDICNWRDPGILAW